MKIVIDDKIPYIRGAFEPVADVVYLPGSKTSASDVKDADVLITRTRTICNESLLKGSPVKFIATATIGYDHIDTQYCNRAGIKWTNAPGCNAGSVKQYIASALFAWSLQKRIPLKDKTIGIVGVGQVGSRIEKFCRAIGLNVLLNDPPRQEKEGEDQFVSLKTIQKEADIITLHVPLNETGPYATRHMVDMNFMDQLVKKPLLLNSCRGEVIDSNSLYYALDKGKIEGFIADCWENEPDIDQGLLEKAIYGTPHIAGYSRDGKANGTAMSVQAVSRFFNLGLNDWHPLDLEEPDHPIIEMDGKQRTENSILAEAVLSTYDIENDDQALRKAPQLFETLRGDYPVRREFHAFTLKLKNIDPHIEQTLKTIGFNIRK